MKLKYIILYIISAICLLTGCDSTLFSSRRDMEHLKPVLTMGLDRQGDGILMSISTGTGPEGDPALVMTAAGAGIEDAIERLQDHAPENELFYAHVRYILLGQSMTDDSILPLLDWVERSPAMRMDTPMLVVQGSASEAVTDASDGGTDITDRLLSLEREERFRGRQITNLRDTAAGLLEQGGALCTAAAAAPSAEPGSSSASGGAALLPAGWAVLRPGEKARFLTEEEAMGAAILTGQVNGTRTALKDAVLDLTAADVSVDGRWDDGQLTGLRIDCRLQAGIVEQREPEPADTEELTDQLCRLAAAWLRAVVGCSQAMGCDFLSLRGQVLRAALDPGPDTWKDLFPALPLDVTVEAVLDRSYDLTT